MPIPAADMARPSQLVLVIFSPKKAAVAAAEHFLCTGCYPCKNMPISLLSYAADRTAFLFDRGILISVCVIGDFK